MREETAMILERLEFKKRSSYEQSTTRAEELDLHRAIYKVGALFISTCNSTEDVGFARFLREIVA
jgi:hypothetical protein